MSLSRLLLQSDYNRDLRRQQRGGQEEGAAAGLWGNIGGAGGGLLAAYLLSAGLGGIPLALAVGASSGAGSFLGSKLGAASVKDIGTKFGQQSLADTEKEIKDQQIASAITSAGTAATMSYMGGLGAGGEAPVDDIVTAEAGKAAQLEAQKSVSALASVDPATGITTGPLSSLPNIGTLQSKQANLAQLTPGTPAYKTLSGEIASLQSQLPGGQLTGDTMMLGGDEWDLSFIKDYQTAVEGGVGDPFLQQYGQQYGQTALTEATAKSIADQKAGAMLTGRGYMSPGSRRGFYGKGGESMFDFDALKAAPGKGMDWMQQHPWMSTLGGGGLLALLMMMNQGRQ